MCFISWPKFCRLNLFSQAFLSRTATACKIRCSFCDELQIDLQSVTATCTHSRLSCMNKCSMSDLSLSASCKRSVLHSSSHLQAHRHGVAVLAVTPVMMSVAAVQSTRVFPPYASSHTLTEYTSIHCQLASCNMYNSAQCACCHTAN